MSEQAEGKSTGGEQPLWRGGPSQWVNFKAYLASAAIAVAIIAACVLLRWYVERIGGWAYLTLLLLALPLGHALWRYLETRFHQFELTSERMRVRRGVLSRRTDELELYRVRDTYLEEPFVYRLVGLGTVVMNTSDETHPTFALRAIRDAATLQEKLRERVEAMRQHKKVREVDFE